MKTRLLAEYERLLDKMLANKAEAKEIQLSEIEQAAIGVGEAVKGQVVQAMSEVSGTRKAGLPGLREGLEPERLPE